jgi:hypothetical protein
MSVLTIGFSSTCMHLYHSPVIVYVCVVGFHVDSSGSVSKGLHFCGSGSGFFFGVEDSSLADTGGAGSKEQDPTEIKTRVQSA